MGKKYYTTDHEWIDVDGDSGAIGISNYAQEQLGDVVFIELPEAGTDVGQGDELAVVESVKAASEIYAPVAGTVTEVNEDLTNTPGLVNDSAEDEGWFVKIKIAEEAELSGLMSEDDYKEFLGTLS